MYRIFLIAAILIGWLCARQADAGIRDMVLGPRQSACASGNCGSAATVAIATPTASVQATATGGAVVKARVVERRRILQRRR